MWWQENTLIDCYFYCITVASVIDTGSPTTEYVVEAINKDYGYIVSHWEYGERDDFINNFYSPQRTYTLRLRGIIAQQVKLVAEDINLKCYDNENKDDIHIYASNSAPGDPLCKKDQFPFYVTLSSSADELVFKFNSIPLRQRGFWLSYEGES